MKTKSRFNAQQHNSFLSSRRNHMVLDGWLDASMRARLLFSHLQKSNFLFRANKHFARDGAFFFLAASAVATSNYGKCVHCCVFYEHIFLYDDDGEGKKTKKGSFFVFKAHYRGLRASFYWRLHRSKRTNKELTKQKKRKKKRHRIRYLWPGLVPDISSIINVLHTTLFSLFIK